MPIIFLAALIGLSGQVGEGQERYETYCASCHMADAPGGDLFDGHWMYGDQRVALFNSVKNGIEDAGMPAFESLTDEQIWAVVDYILEEERNAVSKAVALGHREDVASACCRGDGSASSFRCQ